MKAKALNIVYLLLQFLTWIGCCVAFGAPLESMKQDAIGFGSLETRYTIYAIRFTGENDLADGRTSTFSGSATDIDRLFDSRCEPGGNSLIAFNVFAFLGLLLSMALTISRIVGVQLPLVSHVKQSLFYETILIGWNVVNTFLALTIYGGACYHHLEAANKTSVTATGYAYIIVCFFLIIFAGVALYFIKDDYLCYLGIVTVPAGGGIGSDSASGSEYIAHENGAAKRPNALGESLTSDKAGASDSYSYQGYQQSGNDITSL